MVSQLVNFNKAWLLADMHHWATELKDYCSGLVAGRIPVITCFVSASNPNFAECLTADARLFGWLRSGTALLKSSDVDCKFAIHH